VIAVEGISDRIILQRASDVTNRNLDRLGVSVIETGGSGDMAAIVKLFGADGFQVPMSLLIDEDARETTADALGVDPADLEKHGVWICHPDIEAEYVAALGPAALWEGIEKSGLFSANQRNNCEKTGAGGARTHDDVADFCRHQRYKVSAALAVAPLVTGIVVPRLKSVGTLLDAVAS
jgi:putative ATP-dependent endonuclease of OLD family